MKDAFDPYLEWLEIPPREQPPHHYRLLGVRVFENDSRAIDQAADKRMAQLRPAQIGKHAALSQKLLNEVAAARACLANPRRRAAYDAELKVRFGERRVSPAPALDGRGAPQQLTPLEPIDDEDALTEFDIASLPPLQSYDPLGPALTASAPARPVSPAPSSAPVSPAAPLQVRRPQTPQPYAQGKPAPYAAQPAYYPAPTRGMQVSLRALVLFFSTLTVLLVISIIGLMLLLALLPRDGETFGSGSFGGSGSGAAPGYGREPYMVTGVSLRNSFEIPRSGKWVLSRDGSQIATINLGQRNILRYDTARGAFISSTGFAPYSLRAAAYSPVDDALVVALADGALGYSFGDGRSLTIENDRYALTTAMVVAPDGRTIATKGIRMQLLDWSTGAIHADADYNTINYLQFSPDGSGVCGFRPPGNVWLGEMPPPPLGRTVDVGQPYESTTLAWSQHGELVALYHARDPKRVSIVYGASGRKVCDILDEADIRYWPASLSFVPNSTTVNYENDGGRVLLQPVDDATQRTTNIRIPDSSIFSADGSLMVAQDPTASSPDKMRFDVYTVERQPR